MTLFLLILTGIIALLLKAWFSSTPTPTEAPRTNLNEAIQPVLSFLALKELQGCTILEQSAQSRHPDAPVKICLQLNESARDHVRDHIRSMAFTSKQYGNKDQTVVYEERYRQLENSFQKNYKASHVTEEKIGYTFFMARLNLDFTTGILQYTETGL